MVRRELIERHAFSESFADKLIEGLEKAGLKEAQRVTLAVLPFVNIGATTRARSTSPTA